MAHFPFHIIIFQETLFSKELFSWFHYTQKSEKIIRLYDCSTYCNYFCLVVHDTEIRHLHKFDKDGHSFPIENINFAVKCAYRNEMFLIPQIPSAVQ